MQARLATLRERLDRLRAADPRLRAFGAAPPHGHGYREQAPLDEASLARLEETCGVALPEELRAFLTTVHGGGPGPGYGLDVTPRRQAVRAFPYGSSQGAEILKERERDRRITLPMLEDEDDGDDWPTGPGFLPICHQGCGVFDVIVVAGEERGRVWWCDMGWAPYGLGFLDWYEAWLDRCLSPKGLARLGGT